MKKLINDWRPETSSLIARLQKAGATIISVHNGEYSTKFSEVSIDKFILEAIACDTAHLFITLPCHSSARLFLVYGNNPGELVCDYSIPSRENDSTLLDEITSAHYDEWVRKPQPKMEVNL